MKLSERMSDRVEHDMGTGGCEGHYAELVSDFAVEVAQLESQNAELLADLELAVRYLAHPDVQVIPFALHASAVVERIEKTIRKVRGE